MLKTKPALITIIDDKKGKSQSWEAHLSRNDGFSNEIYQCDLIGYGASEKEACKNLNVAFNKLFMAIIDQPTLADLVDLLLPNKDPHGETNWGPDGGLEIIEY